MSSLKERLIAGATIVGTVVACVALGYALGKDTNDGLVNFLRERNQVAEKTEVQLRAEVSALKLELQGSKQPTSTLSGSAVLDPVTASGGAAGNQKSDEQASVRVVLRTGETATPFDGRVLISLVGIKYHGDPLRHAVSASIGSPGKSNKTLESVDVGFAIVYEGYEVRLVASDTLTGTFLVTRLPAKA